jgi:hypothetical protein
MLDWPTEHGWSVAATIREASDERVDVELFDLTAAGAVDSWVPGVTDVQVLVQLCAVAEAAQTGNPGDPGARPLAVNLSFGRRRPEVIDGSSESGLERSVRHVLSHLVDKEGIPVVAAAGNHHEMLFPASSPDVVSAGALDLAWLEQGGQPRASAQTPPTARALMPGYGLYLTSGNAVWPAPPGSSYAAAVLTGWLSGTLAGGDADRLPEGDRWTPIDTAGGLALALDGVPLPGSELAGPRRLLDRAMGEDPIPPRSTGNYATLRLDGPAMTLPERSILYAETGNGPQPGVNPCVPCHGSGGSGMLKSGREGDLENADTVAVDLSFSRGLPPQTDLLAVLLRVGDEVYAFEGCRDPGLLAAMAAGSLDGLIFTDVGGIFPPGEQASLVLVVNVGGPAYWHEVPLNLHR